MSSGLHRKLLLAKTLLRLGPISLIRVAAFRLKKKSGYFAWRYPGSNRATLKPEAVLFSFKHQSAPPFDSENQAAELVSAKKIISGIGVWYSAHELKLSFPYDWRLNPFSGARVEEELHWTKIPEPHSCGDIKDVWEQSRFEWAVALARAFRISGDSKFLDSLNEATADWIDKNPPERGPQWMCGQETSIRLLNLLRVHRTLYASPSSASPAFVELIAHSLKRIRYGLSYALGQNNNHGLSESVALKIGGAFLVQAGDPSGKKYQRLGERWTRDRCVTLFFDDGGFSQYSVTYHRLALDTLVQIAEWSSWSNEPIFFTSLERNTTQKALNWLSNALYDRGGDAPNLGANDGANPFRIYHEDYRDFRPSIKRASRALSSTPESNGSGWLSPNFGLLKLNGKSSRTSAFLRGAQYRFRPSNSDAGHVDLTMDSEAVLIDSGTYRYTFQNDERNIDLAGASAHCVLLPQGKDPMPRLGRFLFGSWMSATLSIENGIGLYATCLNDGMMHSRSVWFDNEEIFRIEDNVENPDGYFEVRWTLSGTQWVLQDDKTISDGRFALSVDCVGGRFEMSAEKTQVSLHYAKLEVATRCIIRVMPESGKVKLTTKIKKTES